MTNPQLPKDVNDRFDEFATEVQMNAFDHKKITYDYQYIESSFKAFLAAELARKDEEKARIIKEIEKVKYVMPHDDYQEGRNDGLSNAISIIDSESQKETE